MDKVECIGKEFYYSAAGGSSSSSSAGGGGSSSTGNASTTTTIPAFPSLKKLELAYMNSLKEWIVPPSTTGSGATTNYYYCFPLLEEITIEDCPFFTTITPTTTTVFPSLKVLILENVDGRDIAETLVTNHLNSLTSVELFRVPNLISLPRQGLIENNNTLLSLEIFHCHQFEGFVPAPNNEGHDDDVSSTSSCSSSSSSSSSLQSLKFNYCRALTLFPNFRGLTSLRTLKINGGCKIPESVQEELTCLSSSLEHLEHIQIDSDRFQMEWRKSTSFEE